ncbi:unnamed protein product [Diamesa hyperborea]
MSSFNSIKNYRFSIILLLIGCCILILYTVKDDYQKFVLLKSNTVINDRFDWSNYELMEEELKRTGFGEHGESATLTDLSEIEENKESFKTFGMSVIISDKISVNRSVPEFRDRQCFKIKYLKDLPSVSIVIIFNNEVFSVFKRTLHSIYNRTPHSLIKEIILVNDFSTLSYLYEPLEQYIAEHFSKLNIKIINLKERSGLTKARVVGAKAAQSDYLFIMEPHCEMTHNWLPPLIEPLLKDSHLITVPIVDNIEYNQLQYYSNGKGSRGVFDWDLNYNQLPRFPIDAGKQIDPYETPIMTGGIFAIRKDYFFELGPYDEELLIWGAENLEMSFKVWLCGGRLLEVPCSRVGHVFRNFNTFRKHENVTDFVAFNNKRIAEVWMEDFKELVYQRNPNRYKVDVGDLTKAKKFKESLNCKPFQYFLDVVAPDLVEKYPITVSTPFAYGTVKLYDTDLCLDTFNRRINNPLGLFSCQNDLQFPEKTQNFELSEYKDFRLRFTETCLDGYQFKTAVCHKQGGNQKFKYDIVNNDT